MSKQNAADAASSPGGPNKDYLTRAAREALSAATSIAEEAAGKVKQAASETTANLTGEVKELLNRQVSGGADVLSNIARSTRRAADDLESDAPQIASLVRALGAQVDGYAGGLRDQSVEDIWRSATELTRRQPALVFGLAALAGFFALRTIKSAPSTPLRSIPRPSSDDSGGRSQFYGS